MLAFSFGTYGLLKKRASAFGPIEGLTYEGLVLAPVALAYLVWLTAVGQASSWSYGVDHVALLATTGVVTAAPLLCFAGAANRISLTSLGLLQYIAPTLQFLLGVLVFDEPMPTARWVGFALVWCALAIFTVDSFTASRRRTRDATHGPVVEAGIMLDADCLDERPESPTVSLSAQPHPVAEPVGSVNEDR